MRPAVRQDPARAAVAGPARGAGARDTSRPAPPLPPITGRSVKCVNGKAAGFDCHNVELLAFLPISALGGGPEVIVDDLWGWTDSASGREFALVGRTDGTAFVEVTDPVKPRYLGYLPYHQGAHPTEFRGVKVYQHYAFVVSDQSGPHGLQVFDLTQLLAVPRPPAVFQETAHYDRFETAHTLILNEATGYAYAAGGNTCGGGLHMVDVRTPTRPTFAGCYTDRSVGGGAAGDLSAWIHDAQCVLYHGPDQPFRGHELCLTAAMGGLGIADVTDKQHPKTIGFGVYPNPGGIHQGWFTDDQRYFFVDDELDEFYAQVDGTPMHTRTLVFDLAKLEDPVLLTEYYATTTAIDHNLYIRGRYMYQANYAAGLRILDIQDPQHPREVGYLRTTLAADAVATGDGAFGSYPYFRSKAIAVSSMREGLFLVRALAE